MPPDVIHGFVEKMLDFDDFVNNVDIVKTSDVDGSPTWNALDRLGLRFTTNGGAATTAGWRGLPEGNGWLRAVVTADQDDDMMASWGRTLEPVSGGGPIEFSTKVRTSDADKSSIFMGLGDAETYANGIVIEDEDGALNTVPADAFGFLLEGEQDLTIQAVGVKAGADHPQVALTETEDFEDNVARQLKLEVVSNGAVRFLVDTALVHETAAGYFTTGTKAAPKQYAPIIAVSGRGTALNVDWDYLFKCHPRVP